MILVLIQVILVVAHSDMPGFTSCLLPSCVQAPSRLMMFLCLPMIFIISISEMRSDRSFSVASAEKQSYVLW